MNHELLLQNVRPLGGAAVDVLVRDGRIAQMQPKIAPASATTQILDGRNQLLLPGLINAHAHIDKNMLGCLGIRIRSQARVSAILSIPNGMCAER